MASLDSSLSEADRMAQGACDGAEATRPDYAFSGGFIGTGPDSARHGSSADGSQSFMRTCIEAQCERGACDESPACSYAAWSNLIATNQIGGSVRLPLYIHSIICTLGHDIDDCTAVLGPVPSQ